MEVTEVYINEGSQTSDTNKESLTDNWFILVVIGTKFRLYRDRLIFTFVEMDLGDCSVTAACFSETNDILFLGDSKGALRFINL